MINLIPSSTKQDITFARKNNTLLHWTFALAASLVGACLIIAVGMLLLISTTNKFQKEALLKQSELEKQQISETQKQIEDYSSNIKLASDVLSKEVLFSKLLTQLGAALPENSVLLSLQISDLQGSVSLSAGAKNFNAGSQVQVNLQDPKNQIFEKADIENINCTTATDTSETISKYPCTVQIKALFNKKNPFLFIDPTKKAEVKQ